MCLVLVSLDYVPELAEFPVTFSSESPEQICGITSQGEEDAAWRDRQGNSKGRKVAAGHSLGHSSSSTDANTT